jgi:hypothetical protein
LKQQVGRLDTTPGELRGRDQRSALFKTMFLAFRQSGAKDWNSSLAIALDHSGSQHKLQFHHIFPKAVLTRLGRTARDADDIANLAFIAGRTNRRISDKSPSEYLPGICEQAGPAILDAQCIPHEDPLYELSNYDQFLARRRELIADRLNVFLGTDGGVVAGSNSDPYVRDLDTQIEQVELAIRDFIATQFDTDTTLLPRHISDKLYAKVRDAARKNPATATESHSTSRASSVQRLP